MEKSIEVSAKTEEEAIQSALDQLGLAEEDVSVEIVQMARTGFLGLKNTPAVVRVRYGVKAERTDQVEAFLMGLFERMGVEADMDLAEDGDTINVVLTGKTPGVLIGRRGETLDAIQHLTNYVVNRKNAGRVRVNLDAENYRQRRNETLEALAARTAEKVLKYRRNISLDPMNAYERHVIHSSLQEHGNISTFSVGSEPNRRIVVAYGRQNENRSQPNRDGRGARPSRTGSRQERPERDGRDERPEREGRDDAGGGVPPPAGVEGGDSGPAQGASRAATPAPQNYREWS